MLKVGLTGGLACGKSFVGEALESMGCHLLRADQVGHEVMRPGGEAYDAIIREFGTGILNPDATINRRKLGAEVFGDPERLELLSAIVHPAVLRREDEFMQWANAVDPYGIAVLEAAILIETGSYKRFERLILVVCGEDQQVTRAMKRDALEREEVLARLRRQMPLEEKRKYADYVIDSSGTKEETLRQVRDVYEALRSIAK